MNKYMIKFALIVPNNLWVCPYVLNYSNILDNKGVQYDIISWNRSNKKELGIQYNKHVIHRSLLGILWSYFLYSRFVKRTLKAGNYDKIIVFSPQLAIFLANYLRRHYKGRYILDYRDLSIEQKPLLGQLFKIALQNSYANVISSPGFKKYLPIGIDYVICHNLNMGLVRESLNKKPKPYNGKNIKVLTIGALRKDMNIEVMDALGDVEGFEMSFVGKGISENLLKDYAKNKGFKNIVFTGFYKKENEAAIIKDHALINIVYPLIPSHISALSNRFYNSLIQKRPMIVTKGTIQGDYAEQYNVGLVITDCEGLSRQILDYLRNLDFDNYSERCNLLLDSFLKENITFEKVIISFCNN